jgi:hypothetical protein
VEGTVGSDGYADGGWGAGVYVRCAGVEFLFFAIVSKWFFVRDGL